MQGVADSQQGRINNSLNNQSKSKTNISGRKMFAHVFNNMIFTAEVGKRRIDSIGRQASLMCDRVIQPSYFLSFYNTAILFVIILHFISVFSIVNR